MSKISLKKDIKIRNRESKKMYCILKSSFKYSTHLEPRINKEDEEQWHTFEAEYNSMNVIINCVEFPEDAYKTGVSPDPVLDCPGFEFAEIPEFEVEPQN